MNKNNIPLVTLAAVVALGSTPVYASSEVEVHADKIVNHGLSGKSAVRVTVKDEYTDYIFRGETSVKIPLTKVMKGDEIVVESFSNVGGDTYRLVGKYSTIAEHTSDDVAVFLSDTYYSDYVKFSDVVDMYGQVTVEEFVGILLEDWSYDTEKRDRLYAVETPRYLPNLNELVEQKKGICFDFSSLVATVLRANGIPTKIVNGYVDNRIYHSWNEVYSEGEWKIIDMPYLLSGSKDSIYASPLRYTRTEVY